MNRLAKWQVIVPARLASSRLERKPLVDIAGLPLVARTSQNLQPLRDAGATVTVAADDDEIVKICEKHNIPVVLTGKDYPTGTDRCYSVAQNSSRPYVLNVQVDEPFLAADDLIGLAEAFHHQNCDLGTLAFPSNDSASFLDPHTVKVVSGQYNRALYFSRSPVPFHRDSPGTPQGVSLHVGVYVYTQTALAKFCALPTGRLESIERLEQLRALENGMTIYVHPATVAGHGIDTPEDLEKARARF